MTSIVLAIISGFMMCADKNNWGWVMFAAILVSMGEENNRNDNNNK